MGPTHLHDASTSSEEGCRAAVGSSCCCAASSKVCCCWLCLGPQRSSTASACYLLFDKCLSGIRLRADSTCSKSWCWGGRTADGEQELKRRANKRASGILVIK